eukprot:1459207-Alexandrium_andersonii.AAC.1
MKISTSGKPVSAVRSNCLTSDAGGQLWIMGMLVAGATSAPEPAMPNSIMVDSGSAATCALGT